MGRLPDRSPEKNWKTKDKMTNQELLQIYSAYLPYGVKCVAQGYNVDDFSDPVTPKEFELVGISDCKWCEIHEIGRTVTEQSYFKETYLLLRPLSDLTKEIEHNGEKFVPIKEIGDKYFGNLKRYECDGEISYGWDEQGFDDAQGYQFSFCEESIVFGVWYDVKEEGDDPIYSVGGYNDIVKLFEWHFDVFSLIDQNIAINLNKVK